MRREEREERGREREREREREGERERESRYLCFQLIFFGPLLFTCVGAFMGAERGGGGGKRFLPPVEKLAGQVSPRNEDISDTFFLTRFKMLHFQHMQKRWPNSEEKIIFGVGGLGCLMPSNAYDYEFIIRYSEIVHL